MIIKLKYTILAAGMVGVGAGVRSSCDISRWQSEGRSTNYHLAAVDFKPTGAETRWGLVRMGLRRHQLILQDGDPPHPRPPCLGALATTHKPNH